MVLKTPPLGSVRAFDAAARHLSFTKAAAELGITQAAVSWQIKTLEHRLKATLFQRGRKGLSLTPTGQQLAPNVAAALVQLGKAFEEVFPASNPETIRVSVSPTFANAWLVPRLERFRALHPSITIEMDATGEIADVPGGAVDIAVRHGKGPWPGLSCRHLLRFILLPVCAPGLVSGRQLPLSAAEIASLPMLQPARHIRPWFAAHAGVELMEASPQNAAFHQEHMAGSAAMAGQGVAFINPHFWQDALEDGRLVPIAPEIVVDDNDGYWLVYLDRPSVPKTIRQFRDWMVAEIAASGPSPATAGTSRIGP